MASRLLPICGQVPDFELIALAAAVPPLAVVTLNRGPSAAVREALPHRPLDAAHLALHQRYRAVVYLTLQGASLTRVDLRAQERQGEFRNGKESAT